MARANPKIDPNQWRRSGSGLLLWLALPFLHGLGWLLRPRSAPSQGRSKQTLVVFKSYLVGDFFMALPALKELHRHLQVLVISRPDCIPFLKEAGIPALPFSNRFYTQPDLKSALHTFREAWGLRSQILSALHPLAFPREKTQGLLAEGSGFEKASKSGLGPGMGLDLDADPRSAFWMKVMGIRNTLSWHRSFGHLFDATFPLPASVHHQQERDAGAVLEFLQRRERYERRFGVTLASVLKESTATPESQPAPATPAPHPSPATDAAWLVGLWTRKDVKNWPWEKWRQWLASDLAQNLPLRFLLPPDGDAEFDSFRAEFSNREWVSGNLLEVRSWVQQSAGVITLDNFLGHLAASEGKPVVWINGGSDPTHVRPLGPATAVVQVESMPCRPCRNRCVNPRYKECLETLEPEAVNAALRQLLSPVLNA